MNHIQLKTATGNTWRRISKLHARKIFGTGQQISIMPKQDVDKIHYINAESKFHRIPTFKYNNEKVQHDLSSEAAFDAICRDVQQRHPSAQLYYFANVIKIPRFYNVIDNFKLNLDDGSIQTGTVFYLCDRPSDEMTDEYRQNGITFLTAVSEYAPEIRKPLMFIPTNSVTDFE